MKGKPPPTASKTQRGSLCAMGGARRKTTVVLGSLSNATRVFANAVTEEILDIEALDEGDFAPLAPLASGERTKKMFQENGDWDDAMWSCGQSIGLIDDIPTCKVLCDRIVNEAEKMLSCGAAMVSKL